MPETETKPAGDGAGSAERNDGTDTRNLDEDVVEDDGDVEAAIRRELQTMKPTPGALAATKQRQTFTPIMSAMECVFFMRTRQPVVPTELIVRMCAEAQQAGASQLARPSRFIDRVTPVSHTDKATENGIKRIAQKVMGPHFQLSDAVKPSVEGEQATGDLPAPAMSAECVEKLTDSEGTVEMGPTVRFGCCRKKKIVP